MTLPTREGVSRQLSLKSVPRGLLEGLAQTQNRMWLLGLG